MLRNAARRARLVAAVMIPALIAGASACSDLTAPAPYVAQYITVRRAWRPGERDSLIARVVTDRAFALPYVGDISDNAALLIPADSATDIVPNPAFSAHIAVPFGPMFSIGATVPGVSWQVLGLRIHIVNNNQSGDTYDWLGYVFYNTGDPTWKGLMLAASGANAVNKVVNTPAFDAANAQSGAGGGEVQASSGTYWQANGLGSPNKLSVTASSFHGTPTTVTTGPFLGGTALAGTMTGDLQTIVMTRVLGSAGDAADTASIAITDAPSTQYSCIFPTPCTTNAVAPAQPAPPWLAPRGAAAMRFGGSPLR